MSSQAGISRRALLGFLRRKEEPAPAPEPERAPAFSLDAFYSARAQSGEATGTSIPVFSLREGLAIPQDGVSRIGMAPLAPPPVAQGAGAAGVVGAPVAGMTVRVRTQLCLACQGSFCSTCSERCPVEGAIAFELGQPRVVDERCNGCGICVQVCPAPLNPFEFVSSRPRGSAS